MAVFNKFQKFPEDLAKGVHNLSTGALRIALTNLANTPVVTNTILSNLTEIVYTNISGNGGGTGGRTCTTSSCVQTAGVLQLVLADLVLTGVTGTAPGFINAVLYNDTPTSPLRPLICWWTYPGGTDIALAVGETLTLDFDNTAGVLAIS